MTDLSKPPGLYYAEARVLLQKDGDLDAEIVCAAVLLAASHHSARLYRLKAVLLPWPGVNRRMVTEYFRRFRREGVFTRDGLISHGCWDDPKSGTIAFILDVAVGVGFLRRG